MRSDKVTQVWELYQNGVSQHSAVNMYSDAEREHNFYIGEQWRGLSTGGEELPILNIIKPVIRYKVSMIARQLMRIVYVPMGQGERRAELCRRLTKYAEKQWEKLKMDYIMWSVVKNAAITGDHYLYCFSDASPLSGADPQAGPKLGVRLVDKTNVYFADEQNPDINSQEWVMLSERVPVSKVTAEAKRNGLGADKLALIAPDEDTVDDVGQNTSREVKSEKGKCTSLLFMRRTSEGLRFCRATKNVVFCPEKLVPGLDVYPLCGMRWEEVKGDSRGASAVKQMIPNQLEVNKTAARRAIAVKRFAFPTVVADRSRIQNIDELDNVNSKIFVDGLGDNPVDRFIQYLKPAPISEDAAGLQRELIESTQMLEGAGDAALRQANPETASGESIRAAKNEAALTLCEQTAAYKQFVEDVAVLWYRLWTVYTPGGIELCYKRTNENGETQTVREKVEQSALRALDVDVKVEVSEADPYYKYASDVKVERLLEAKHITLEEYAELLSDDGTLPKAKLLAILEARKRQEEPNALKKGGDEDAGVHGILPGVLDGNGADRPREDGGGER